MTIKNSAYLHGINYEKLLSNQMSAATLPV